MSKPSLFAYKFTILMAVLILTALLLPAKTFPKISSPLPVDKLIHASLFFLFASAFVVEYRRDRKSGPGILLESALLVPFVLLSEVLQLFTKSRHFELGDLAADFIGAGMAILLSWILRRRSRPGQKELRGR